MTKQTINIGQSANDKTGDTLRAAFNKINQNFTELFNVNVVSQYRLGDDVQFVQIELDGQGVPTGGITVQSGYNTTMPVYIKGGNAAGGGVGGNVIIEAGAPPLGTGQLYNGTVGDIEINGNTTTINSLGNITTFATNPDGTPYITFPVSDGGQIGIQGVELSGTSELILAAQSGSLFLSTNPTVSTRQDWEFDTRGTINVPHLFPVTFIASLDEAHAYPSLNGASFVGSPWIYNVTIRAVGDGQTEIVCNTNAVWNMDPYLQDFVFQFTEADHGIPNYTLTISLHRVNAYQAGWAGELSFSISPTYPSTINSQGAIKLKANAENFIFGADGVVYLPTGGDIKRDGVSVLNTGTDRLTNNGHTVQLQSNGVLQLPVSGAGQAVVGLSALAANEDSNGLAKSFKVDVNGAAWYFDRNGVLTLPSGGIIKDHTGHNISDISQLKFDDSRRITMGGNGAGVVFWRDFTNGSASGEIYADSARGFGLGDLSGGGVSISGYNGNKWTFDVTGKLMLAGDIYARTNNQVGNYVNSLPWGNIGSGAPNHYVFYGSNPAIQEAQSYGDLTGYTIGLDVGGFTTTITGMESGLFITADPLPTNNLSLTFFLQSPNFVQANAHNLSLNTGFLGDNKTWTFGTDGTLAFPNGSQQSIAAMSFRGTWDPEGSYVSNVDVVTYNGGSYLKISGNGNSGSSPDGDPVRWQEIGSNANTGNIGFIGDAMYDFSGITVENADLSHGATSALIIPANGSSDSAQLNNTYGDITIGTGSGGPAITSTWTFGTDGTLTLPTISPAGYPATAWVQATAKLILNANGSLYQFGADNALEFPNGGQIIDFNGTTIVVNTTGGTIIGSGEYKATVAARTTGNVDIIANDGSNGDTSGKTWTFGTDGSTTFPNNTIKVSDYLAISNGTGQYTGIANNLTDNGTSIHIPKSDNPNLGNQVQVGFLVTPTWSSGATGHVTGISEGTGGFGPEWIFSVDTNFNAGFVGGAPVTFGTPLNIWSFGSDGSLELPGAITTVGTATFGATTVGHFDANGAASFAENVEMWKDLRVHGNINFNGSVTSNTVNTQSGVFTGQNPQTGFGALYAGINRQPLTFLPATVFQMNTNSNEYTQMNYQNLGGGNQASAEYVITADNGTDATGYIDMGIASSGWDGSQSNSLGTAVLPNDGWIYVQNGTGTAGGNLVLGASSANKRVKIVAGGFGTSNIVADFSASGLNVVGAVTAASFTGALTGNVTGNVSGSAGSVDWANIANKPTLFSGSYTDLTNKPTLSTVATSGSYTDLTNKPTLFSGSYTDLTNKPTLFSGAYADLTGKPTLATVATSGSYTDLSNKPTIPSAYTLPTATTSVLGGVKVDGTTITINNGVISSAGGGGTSVTVSDTPPSSPNAGDLWYESDVGKLKIYYSSTWIDASPSGPNVPYRVNETFGYQNQVGAPAATTYAGPATIPNWTASYTGSGGKVKVTMNFTAYASSGGNKTFNLQRDGVTVASVNFFFNGLSTHTTLPTIYYIDSSLNIASHTYSLVIPAGVTVDTQDYATMIFTEY